MKCPCGKDLVFRVPSERKRKKFCSRPCKAKHTPGLGEGKNKGQKAWNKGPGSMAQTQGENHWTARNNKRKKFKGTEAEYVSLHKWVRRANGPPVICSFCHASNHLQWANVSGDYLKLPEDWIQLCIPCHIIFDGRHLDERCRTNDTDS